MYPIVYYITIYLYIYMYVYVLCIFYALNKKKKTITGGQQIH